MKKTKAENEAKMLFDRLVQHSPREELWPAVVGLLQHLLLEDDATLSDYYYGVFAVTDTLRDAAIFQKARGHGMEAALKMLTEVRKWHLARNG